jgi:hypothetical protein
VKIEEKRGRGGLRAGEGKTTAGLGQGCLAEARVRGGGPVLKKLAQGQHLIINTHFFFIQILFQFEHQLEPRSNSNFTRFLIAKLNLTAHINRK